MSDIDVYVLSGNYTKRLLYLLKHLQMNKLVTAECLLNYGFTNYDAPYYYKVWSILESDKYPVSFAMTIKKKGMKIESFELLDENFMQPHPCGKEEYEQIKKIVTIMIDKNILEVYTNDK